MEAGCRAAPSSGALTATEQTCWPAAVTVRQAVLTCDGTACRYAVCVAGELLAIFSAIRWATLMSLF